ncbi:condensation domain-containing protein [Streptomyces sp. NPDC006544]|uniref:condensation domain-containing protein n=1 Tax=Streptomyces sp. NPDC006544 TaxID=3154583 RepID=UPI0033AF2105
MESRLLARMRRFRVSGIDRRPHPTQPVRLSFAQQRLWFLEQLAPGGVEYSMPFAFRASGRLDVAALESAFSGLVRRHEVLRTRFVVGADQDPVQVVEDPWAVRARIVDLTDRGAEAAEAAGLEVLAEEAARPFDLTSGRLLRLVVVRLASDAHLMAVTMHHIVADGWSTGILAKELPELYAACMAGREAQLAELPIQYADYAMWQRDQLQGEDLERQLAYWRSALAGLVPLELPTDRPRPPVRSGRGSAVDFTVPGETTAALHALAQREGATLFMLLLALFKMVLGKWSGQDDVTVGVPIAGRNRVEVEELIGFFVNTLVLRSQTFDDPRFDEFLRRVKGATLSAYEHQDMPFERLVEDLAPTRDLSRTPLVQAVFALQNATETAWQLPGVRIDPLPSETKVEKFDVTMVLSESQGGLEGSLTYSNDLFDRETVERMAGYFRTLLSAVVADPAARLGELHAVVVGQRGWVGPPAGAAGRSARPDPGEGPDQDEVEYVAPRSPVERTIAGIWGDVLDVARVGVHDNFFLLGGHSLMAARITSQLSQELGFEVTVRTLFEAQTVENLAGVLAAEHFARIRNRFGIPTPTAGD